jgi:hypothetical protein
MRQAEVWLISLLLLVAVGLVTMLGVATAQPRQIVMPHFCDSTETIRTQLADQYSERVQSNALTGDAKYVVEVWVSESGSFTVLQSDAKGMSCIMTGGDSFQTFDLKWGPKS